MTRKLVIINMSNWADEAFHIVRPNEWSPDEYLRPGEYTIINPGDTEVLTIASDKIGKPNGYEPPAFPLKAVSMSEEINPNSLETIMYSNAKPYCPCDGGTCDCVTVNASGTGC